MLQVRRRATFQCVRRDRDLQLDVPGAYAGRSHENFALEVYACYHMHPIPQQESINGDNNNTTVDICRASPMPTCLLWANFFLRSYHSFLMSIFKAGVSRPTSQVEKQRRREAPQVQVCLRNKLLQPQTQEETAEFPIVATHPEVSPPVDQGRSPPSWPSWPRPSRHTHCSSIWS